MTNEQLAVEFLQVLAVCHECIIDKDSSSEQKLAY